MTRTRPRRPVVLSGALLLGLVTGVGCGSGDAQAAPEPSAGPQHTAPTPADATAALCSALETLVVVQGEVAERTGFDPSADPSLASDDLDEVQRLVAGAIDQIVATYDDLVVHPDVATIAPEVVDDAELLRAYWLQVAEVTADADDLGRLRARIHALRDGEPGETTARLWARHSDDCRS